MTKTWKSIVSLLLALVLLAGLVPMTAPSAGAVDSEFKPIWPLESFKRISTLDYYYDYDNKGYGTAHKGIDIPATIGTPVKAVEKGTIVWIDDNCEHNYGKSDYKWDTCGSISGCGNFVVIDHDINGTHYCSVYMHLTKDSSSNTVCTRSVGEVVEKGDIIAYSGSTGWSTGGHLHLELMKGDLSLYSKDKLQDLRSNVGNKSFEYYLNNLSSIIGVDIWEEKIKYSKLDYKTIIPSIANSYIDTDGTTMYIFTCDHKLAGYETKKKSDGTYAAFCKECGREYVIPNIDTSTAGVYRCTVPAPKCSQPFQETKKMQEILTIGHTYNIEGSLKNAYGDTWYKVLNEDRWIYEGYIKKVTPTSAPSAPDNLKATWGTNNVVNLSWNAVSGATSYKVEYCHEAQTWTADRDYNNNTATSYTSSTTGRDWYKFRVCAVNEVGDSSWSEITINKSSTATIPATPTGITAIRSGTSNIKVSWNTVSGATKYKLEYKTSTMSGWIETDGSKAGISSNSVTEVGFSWNGYDYVDFRVYASNFAGTSSVSQQCRVYKEAATYTIAYNANANDVTGVPSAQTKTQGSALTLSSTKPTRSCSTSGSYTVTLNANGGSVSSTSLSANRNTSYTFKNWNTAADGSGTAYNSGASYTADASVTLYAQWNSETTTSTVTLPTPTRTGYTFKGWAESATATSGTTGSYKPNGDITLYAIWEPNTYTVSFNSRGGSYEDSNQTTKGVTFDNAYGTLPVVTREGYTFEGWYTAADDDGIKIDESSFVNISENHTLFAHWSVTGFSISFSANGGTGKMNDLAYELYKGFAFPPCEFTPPSGMKFKTWIINDEEWPVGSIFVPEEAKHVVAYAVWEDINSSLTIRFNANGADGDVPDNINIGYGEAALIPDNGNLVKPGYVLNGWNTDANGEGESYESGATVKNITGDGTTVTLYAQWKKKTVTVKAFPLVNRLILLAAYNEDNTPLAYCGTQTYYDERFNQLTEFNGKHINVTIIDLEYAAKLLGLNITNGYIDDSYISSTSEDIAIAAASLFEPAEENIAILTSSDKDSGMLNVNGSGEVDIVDITLVYNVWKGNYNFAVDPLSGAITDNLLKFLQSDITFTLLKEESLDDSADLANCKENVDLIDVKNIYYKTYQGEAPEPTEEKVHIEFELSVPDAEDPHSITIIPNEDGSFDPILITMTVHNLDGASSYSLRWMQDEILLDGGFFYSSGSRGSGNKVDVSFVTFLGSPMVKLSTMSRKLTSANSSVANFYITPIKGLASGTTTVLRNGNILCYDANDQSYDVSAQDLTITVGSRPIPTAVVTFSANGGTMDPTAFPDIEVATDDEITPYYAKAYPVGDLITLPAAPARENYFFNGWTDGTNLYAANAQYTVPASDTRITASWTKYPTVSFDPNGGAFSGATSVRVVPNTAFDLPNITKANNTFLGWSDGEKTATGKYLVGINDVTLTALWQVWPTLTLDAAGGTISEAASRTVLPNTTVTLPTPGRSGYDFLGWYLGETRYTDSYFLGESSVTLTARWAQHHTLTLDANGGNITGGITSFTGAAGMAVELPGATKTNARFGGWSDGTNGYGGSFVMPDADVTLTALWTDFPTLLLDANGGNVEQSAYTVAPNSNVTLPTPTREGYIFEGWKLGSETYTDSYTIAFDNVTLRAEWKAYPTLMLDPAEGTLNDAEKSFTAAPNTSITLPTPTRVGYDFAGWSDGMSIYTSNYTLTSSVTLTAQWTECRHTYAYFFVVSRGEWSHVEGENRHVRTNYISAVCFDCGATLTKEEEEFAPCTYEEKWSITATEHFHMCTVCGGKEDTAKHTYNSTGTCTVCNFTDPLFGVTPIMRTKYTINAIKLRNNAGTEVEAIPYGNFYAEVNVTNISSDTVDTLVIAAYNKDGKLLRMYYLYLNPRIGQSVPLSVRIDNTSGDLSKLKAFILSSKDSSGPLAVSFERA